MQCTYCTYIQGPSKPGRVMKDKTNPASIGHGHPLRPISPPVYCECDNVLLDSLARISSHCIVGTGLYVAGILEKTKRLFAILALQVDENHYGRAYSPYP